MLTALIALLVVSPPPVPRRCAGLRCAGLRCDIEVKEPAGVCIDVR